MHSEFESDFNRFIQRLKKFGFKSGPVHKEEYGSKIGNHHGEIYSTIIKPVSQLNEERMVDLSVFMPEVNKKLEKIESVANPLSKKFIIKLIKKD